jgi:hypothetical protein
MNTNARHSRWLAAVALSATALLAAGCSGGSPSDPKVASISPSADASSPDAGGAEGRPSALAYSKCMRAHGISDFPDPNSSGDIALNAQPGSDIDPNNPKYQAADRTCKPLMPDSGPPASPEKIKDANLKYARCMRSHGISDFPDPRPDGTLQVQNQPGGDLDANNPQYKKADDACKQHLLGGGAGSGTSTGGS